MPRGDSLDDATLYHLLGKLPRSPVGHRAAALFGQLTGYRDDLSELLSRKRGRSARPIKIGQQGEHQVGQIFVARSLSLSFS